jgi:hypothetical protein
MLNFEESNSLADNKRELLDKIKCSYGLSQNVSRLLTEYMSVEEKNAPDDDEYTRLQQALISFILNDPLLLKYAPSVKYKRSFLKSIIALLERLGVEVEQVILDSYIGLISEIDLVHTKHQHREHYLVVFSKVKSKISFHLFTYELNLQF